MRAGIESRGCTFGGILCAMVGVDLAYQRTAWTGHDVPLFPEDGSTTAPDMTTVTSDMLFVPRIGLDIGGALRVRPSLELALGGAGVDGANATLALAYQW